MSVIDNAHVDGRHKKSVISENSEKKKQQSSYITYYMIGRMTVDCIAVLDLIGFLARDSPVGYSQAIYSYDHSNCQTSPSLAFVSAATCLCREEKRERENRKKIARDDLNCQTASCNGRKNWLLLALPHFTERRETKERGERERERTGSSAR